MPMLRFAANLSMMFTELPFLDRFEAAAGAGFKAVEFLFPYEHQAAAIGARLEAFGLTQALFNLPPGNWEAGERGIAALPGREDEFAAGLDRALDYAAALDCPKIHCMAGIASGEAAQAVFISNLRIVAARAANAGRAIMIEPINQHDMPGYFLSDVDHARDLIVQVGAGNVKLQLDIYHRQMTSGNLAACIRDTADITGHIQISNPPDRGEPVDGEIDYRTILRLIEASGYDGWIGCEYRPRADTREGLVWLDRLGLSLV